MATNRRVHEIRPGSVTTFTATLVSESDPTGADVEWLVTSGTDDADPDDAGWTAGSWPGTWSAVTGRVEARTPSIGGASTHATPDIELGAEGEYVLWVRWTTANGFPMIDAATLIYGY